MNTPAPRGGRLAADIGGTFTDVIHFDPATRALAFGKALSTPRRMVEGIAHGVEKAGTAIGGVGLFLHGSTVAINTMLERKGARTALLVTRGFRDAYEIGRINRPDAYNLYFHKHLPLIPRELRFEIDERIDAEGGVVVPLDTAQVERVCDELVARDIEAVAILCLNCYANPAHEIAVRAIVRARLPHAFVTASHELSQEYREFERVSTVAANAYIGPVVSRYIEGIDRHLADAGFAGAFLVVQSTGGLYESAQARTQCVRMLESGPAAGVIGAHALCRELSIPDAIAFDMGGTTAKAGVIHQHRVLTGNLAMVGGYAEGLPIQIPLVDVFEVGTGGGSIAEVDVGGGLSVGPHSAGAEPGPACYGRGGTHATVTDANLVLGRLSPTNFLGGELPLDPAAAHAALKDRVADPLGIAVIEAAEGILRIAVTKMSYAVKGVSTERGFDAAAFTLIAYGGAGPLHASAIAREIGMRHLVIPRAPGHFCAFGMLHSDLRYDFVRTHPCNVASADFDALAGVYQTLVAQGREALGASRSTPAAVHVTYAADMRYVGQEHSVAVELDPGFIEAQDRDALRRRFDAEHQQRYGTHAPGEGVEIVTLRASVTGVMDKPPLPPIAQGGPDAGAARTGERAAWDPESATMHAVPVYDRDRLAAGNRIAGPALIEEHASTTVLLPGDHLEVDAHGNLRITIGGGLT